MGSEEIGESEYVLTNMKETHVVNGVFREGKVHEILRARVQN